MASKLNCLHGTHLKMRETQELSHHTQSQQSQDTSSLTETPLYRGIGQWQGLLPRVCIAFRIQTKVSVAP